jgi:hypothetical protein
MAHVYIRKIRIDLELDRSAIAPAFGHGTSACIATQGRVGNGGNSTASIQMGFEYAF